MHIIFLNPQGNFDNNDSYWTMHPDFGGQLVYVKEIAVEMAKKGHTIDIVTRRFNDAAFPEFAPPFDSYDGVDNLRIVRIPCGPDKFLNKELLWEHLDEWTDNILAFYDNEQTTIDFATGHYGDGGLAAALIKQKRHIPYSFTGHSLGAQKFDKLNHDFTNLTELEATYHFTERIIAERTAIQASDRIFVSTAQERDEQYAHPLYAGTNHPSNPLSFVVAPPGANTTVFAPYWSATIEESTIDKIDATIARDIARDRSALPFVVLASRLDPKKNHLGLVEAYARDERLQARCNLLISLRGVPDAYQDYSMLKPSEITIIDAIMERIKTYDLSGNIMFISIDSQTELADTYRYIAKRGGVFCLTALYEPFGLAPIEAMSTGLPVAVTKYGGPSEVLKEDGRRFGVLLDVHDPAAIAAGLHVVFDQYDHYRNAGYQRVLAKYTWAATADTYLDAIQDVLANPRQATVEVPAYFRTHAEADLDRTFLLRTYNKE